MSVDGATAAWLKSGYDTVIGQDVIAASVWGDAAIESEQVSPFAEKLDALDEAARQIAFLAAPTESVRILVDGLRAALIGKRIDVTCVRGNLSATRCIVIAAEEQQDTDTTILTILRRLG